MGMGITFHPGMRSGEPTINGTRIPAEMIGSLVWHGEDIDAIATDYNLARDDVLTACWFLGTYGVDGRTQKAVTGRKWRTRWERWARENHSAMWQGDFAAVADPPSRDDD